MTDDCLNGLPLDSGAQASHAGALESEICDLHFGRIMWSSKELRVVQFGWSQKAGWLRSRWPRVKLLEPPERRAWVVTEASGESATEGFWRVLEKPAARG